MEKVTDKNQNNSIDTKIELRVWESPQLFVENMESITEGGGIAGGSGDDGFYVS